MLLSLIINTGTENPACCLLSFSPYIKKDVSAALTYVHNASHHPASCDIWLSHPTHHVPQEEKPNTEPTGTLFTNVRGK